MVKGESLPFLHSTFFPNWVLISMFVYRYHRIDLFLSHCTTAGILTHLRELHTFVGPLKGLSTNWGTAIATSGPFLQVGGIVIKGKLNKNNRRIKEARSSSFVFLSIKHRDHTISMVLSISLSSALTFPKRVISTLSESCYLKKSCSLSGQCITRSLSVLINVIPPT